MTDGYRLHIFKTTQEGQTHLFPLTRRPYFATINCLHAAFLKARVLASSRLIISDITGVPDIHFQDIRIQT